MSSNNKTPDLESSDTQSAVADPSAAGSVENERSFADRVGRKNPAPIVDPFQIAVDTVAGVRLFDSKRDRQVAIKFGEGRPEDKPSRAIIDKLKQAGFHWDRTHKIWAHPLIGESSMSTRIEAERLYQEIRNSIRQEKGIEIGPDIPS